MLYKMYEFLKTSKPQGAMYAAEPGRASRDLINPLTQVDPSYEGAESLTSKELGPQKENRHGQKPSSFNYNNDNGNETDKNKNNNDNKVCGPSGEQSSQSKAQGHVGQTAAPNVRQPRLLEIVCCK